MGSATQKAFDYAGEAFDTLLDLGGVDRPTTESGCVDQAVVHVHLPAAAFGPGPVLGRDVVAGQANGGLSGAHGGKSCSGRD